MGKGYVKTYLVQIIDKPHQITVFKGFFTLDILVPRDYVVELTAKID